MFFPLAGEDFYVTPDKLKRYSERLIQFLNEFADALLSAESTNRQPS